MPPNSNQVSVDVLLRLFNEKKVQQGLSNLKTELKKVSVSTVKLSTSNDKLATSEKKIKQALEMVTNSEKKSIVTSLKHRLVLDKKKDRIVILSTETKKLGIEEGKHKSVVSSVIVTNKKQIATIVKTSEAMKRNRVQLQKQLIEHKKLKREKEALKRARADEQKSWSLGIPLLDNLNKRLNSVRWAMVNITFAAIGIAAVLAPFILLTKHAIELETALVGVAKTTGLTKEEVGVLRSEFYALSRVLPSSAVELAEIGKVAGKLGIKKQDISAFTKSVAMISLVTGLTAEDAATHFAKLSSAFDIPIEKVITMGNVVNELENTTAASSANIIPSLRRVGAAASALGISFESASASVATLISAGMEAERSGTRLRVLYTELARSANEFSKIAGFETVVDFRELLGKDADAAFLAVLDGLNKIENGGDRLAKAMEVAGRAGGFAFITLANNIEDFRRNLETANIQAEENTSIIREMQLMLDQTAEEWKILKNVIVADTSAIGSALNEGLLKPFAELLLMFRTGKGAWSHYVEQSDKFHKSLMRGEITIKQYEASLELVAGLLREENYAGAALAFQTLGEQYIALNKLAEESGKGIETIIDKYSTVEEATEAYGTALNALKGFQGDSIEGFTKLEIALENVRLKIIDSFGEDSLSTIQSFLQSIKDTGESVGDFIKRFQAGISLKSEFEQITTVRRMLQDIDKFLGTTSAKANELSVVLDIRTNIKSVLTEMGMLVPEIERAEAAQEEWENETNRLNTVLKEEQAILVGLKNNLKDVNSEISNLSKARFTGETGIQKLISNVDRFLKEQKLADLGVTDSQSFLQNALAKSKDGYDALITSIKETTNVAKDSQSEFDAWQTTIEEFIRESIETGNELGANMSQTITQFQTQLLSTSKFGDETSENEQAVSLLRDAYDVHYGAMHDDVRFAIQAHEDQVNGVFASSDLIVSALRNQWVEQNKWTKAVEDSEQKVDNLKKSLDDSKDMWNNYKKQIQQTKDALTELVRKMSDVIAKAKDMPKNILSRDQETSIRLTEIEKKYETERRIAEIQAKLEKFRIQEEAKWKGYGGGESGGTGYTGTFSNSLNQDVADGTNNSPAEGFDIISAIKDFFDRFTQVSTDKPAQNFDDFISRPGQEPIKFDQNDTIMGAKGGGFGNDITIGDIYLSGITTNDPEDFAYTFAEQIKLHLDAQ